MRLATIDCRSNAPGIMPARLRLAEKPPQTLGPHRDPSVALARYSSPIPHLHSTNLSHAQESAGRRGEWWCGVMGARGRSAAAVGRPFWAVGGSRGVAFAHGCVMAGVHVVFARSAHAVGCSMRASCSTNFLLHVGMCVVCVARRPFRSIAPPTRGAGVTLQPRSGVSTGGSAP